MSVVKTVLLALSAARAVVAQRTPCWVVDTATNVTTAACSLGTCNAYVQLTGAGKHCTSGRKTVTPSDEDGSVNACASAVLDNNCTGDGVFGYSTEVCECTTSDACTVGSGGQTALFQATDDGFCSCPPSVDGAVWGGRLCNIPYNTEGGATADAKFIEELNALNDAANGGELQLLASSAAQARQSANLFNNIDLLSAAVQLQRGFDGEVTLGVTVYGSVAVADWQGYVVEAMVQSLVRVGFDVSEANVRLLEDDVDSTYVNCTCSPLDIPGAPCSEDVDSSCQLHSTHFVITEQPELAIWEISLIIVAGVVVVCLIAIALSFVKSKETKDAEELPHAMRADEKGIEMQKQ